MRSLATRRQHMATSAVLKDVIDLYKLAGFDLIVVETAGIGQSDTEIVDLVDLSLYVMTSEYGAASQLEKIDMLDYADMIVLNKSEKRGAADSLRDVRKQWRRNHPDKAALPDAQLPVFPTIASRFNDPGVNRLFAAICARGEGEVAACNGSGPDGDHVARSAHSRPARSLSRGDRAGRARRECARRAAGAGGESRVRCVSVACRAEGFGAPAGARSLSRTPRSPMRRPMPRCALARLLQRGAR